MNGVWLAGMVALLVAAGVAVQLGWQLPERDAIKKALQRNRTRTDPGTSPTAIAEPR